MAACGSPIRRDGQALLATMLHSCLAAVHTPPPLASSQVAWIGLAAQASATKEGALDNWLAHIADPAGTSLFNTLYK